MSNFAGQAEIKVRELSFAGELHVEHVATHDNSADLLTKSLPAPAYHRHRARLMNLVAAATKSTTTAAMSWAAVARGAVGVRCAPPMPVVARGVLKHVLGPLGGP